MCCSLNITDKFYKRNGGALFHMISNLYDVPVSHILGRFSSRTPLYLHAYSHIYQHIHTQIIKIVSSEYRRTSLLPLPLGFRKITDLRFFEYYIRVYEFVKLRTSLHFAFLNKRFIRIYHSHFASKGVFSNL